LIGISTIMLGADAPAPPKKVPTSTGIYDVKSKDDQRRFSAKDVRKLVEMEDKRTGGHGSTPHPVLVYCFEERSFQYTGGKYNNAEIKYRLHVPKKISFGKKYPLVVHLHGVGESGSDNTLSLAHLHSTLPMMVGPEQEDFFLLVLQCPRDNRVWTFRPTKDGNLDILVAAMEHVIANNPIDEQRLSTFGLSSGGDGVWRLLVAHPEKFAAAVPTSSGATRDIQQPASLAQTAIWTFRNQNDGSADVTSVREAMRVINGTGGYMKLTEFSQGGHAAWRNAMDECNCVSWMIAQKRGGWFNPPPEREFYRSRSLFNCFFAFFLPLGLAAGLLVFQRTQYHQQLHETIVKDWYPLLFARFYVAQVVTPVDVVASDDVSSPEIAPIVPVIEPVVEPIVEPPAEEFRVWTDTTGAKKVNAKIVDFPDGDRVRIQSPQGKIATAKIAQFCAADQALMFQIRNRMLGAGDFRMWMDITGTRTVTAKFAGFQPDGKVILQNENGGTAIVPMELLGQAEREFLAKVSR
jgi:poly(3-hydroxybutyrate) depolymerase